MSDENGKNGQKINGGTLSSFTVTITTPLENSINDVKTYVLLLYLMCFLDSMLFFSLVVVHDSSAFHALLLHIVCSLFLLFHSRCSIITTFTMVTRSGTPVGVVED